MPRPRSTGLTERDRMTENEDGKRLYFLGPLGSFSHQAAMAAGERLKGALRLETHLAACERAFDVIGHVEDGDGLGVLAWENNVEGHVVPNMDALTDALEVAGFGLQVQKVAFDAFVRPGDEDLRQVVAHPHGLAQCRRFIVETGLEPVAAPSNAAACRDLRPGQVALGPAVCGGLYGLETYRSSVQDFQGARTDFLLLSARREAAGLARRLGGGPGGSPRTGGRGSAYESVVVFIPLDTGPGVLAGLLDRIRDAGLNMTSFMSRPIKGNDGTYSFMATIDAAPWDSSLRDVMRESVGRGDWVKTLAVYPGRQRPEPPIAQWMLPRGGAGAGKAMGPDGLPGMDVDKELLW